jgi:hypothetical protein
MVVVFLLDDGVCFMWVPNVVILDDDIGAFVAVLARFFDN